jgi:hypothetical protein
MFLLIVHCNLLPTPNSSMFLMMCQEAIFPNWFMFYQCAKGLFFCLLIMSPKMYQHCGKVLFPL